MQAFLRLDRLERTDLDRADEPAGLARVEAAGADLERRGGAGGDRERSASSAGLPASCAAMNAREQHVARADDRDGLDRRRDALVALDLPLLAEEREAAATRA